MKPRKSYPSDISREQFERIRPLLESVRKRTKPRTVDLYEVFNAVLYLLKSGCQWCMLPQGFPNWVTVYAYFAKWSAPGQDGVSARERALKKSVGEARTKLGRNATTSFVIVDAQSVKNTDTAEEKGYDAGKKISGRKRQSPRRPVGQQLTELPWASNSGPVLSSPPPGGWHTNAFAADQLIATFSTNPDPNTNQTMPAILNYYLTDWLGTRRVMTDSVANVQETCDSLPYGDGESCPPSPTEHLFTGKERDAESGNDYFGARYYASSMGRFLIPDWSAEVEPVPYAKIDNPQSLNLYSYVMNMPLGVIDPDGHNCLLDGVDTPDSVCQAVISSGAAQYNGTTGSTIFTVYNVNSPPTQDENGNPVFQVGVYEHDQGCDPSDPVCQQLMQMDAAANNANAPNKEPSLLASVFKDVKNCIANVALPTIENDLNPFSLGVGTAADITSQMSQSSLAAAASYSVRNGLTVPLRSSIVRAGVGSAETLGKASGILTLIGVDYALADAVYAEYERCQ